MKCISIALYTYPYAPWLKSDNINSERAEMLKHVLYHGGGGAASAHDPQEVVSVDVGGFFHTQSSHRSLNLTLRVLSN